MADGDGDELNQHQQEPGMATTDLTQGRKPQRRSDEQSREPEHERKEGDDSARRRPARETSSPAKSQSKPTRSARVSNAGAERSPGARPSDSLRRAAFNPDVHNQDGESRRQLVNRFGEELSSESPDEWVRPEASGERVAALTALALVDECTGQPDDSWDRLEPIPRGQLPDAGLHLLRRIAVSLVENGAGSTSSLREDLRQTLRASAKHLTGDASLMAEFDCLSSRWATGESVSELQNDVPELDAGEVGDLVAWMHGRLLSDLALETGELQAAKRALTSSLSIDEPVASGRLSSASMKSREIMLTHVLGESHRAFEMLTSRMANESFSKGGKVDESTTKAWCDFALWLARASSESDAETELIQGNRSWFSPRRVALADYRAEARKQTKDEPQDSDQTTSATQIEVLSEKLLEIARTSEHPRIWEGMAERLTRGASDSGPAAVDLTIRCLNRMVEHPDSAEEEAALLVELGDLYLKHAQMAGAAAEVYREALQVRPADGPARRSLERLLEQRGASAELVDLWEHELAYDCATPTARDVRCRIARVCTRELDEHRRAAGHLSAVLQWNPTDAEALDLSREVFPKLDAWQTLIDHLTDAADATDDSAGRVAFLEEAARVATRQLAETTDAERLWQRVRSHRPAHREAFRELQKIYRQGEHPEQLSKLLIDQARHLGQSDHPEDCLERAVADLWARAGSILHGQLDRMEAAAESFKKALSVQPEHDRALRGLLRTLGARQKWDDLIDVMNHYIQEVDDDESAVHRLMDLAERAGSVSERTGMALALCQRALRIADEAGLADLVPRLEAVERRLLASVGEWEVLVDRLRPLAQAGEISWGRIATIAEFHVGDERVAVEAYLKALQTQPDSEEWLEGVRRSWRDADIDPGALADRLESIVTDVEDGDARDRLFTDIARLTELATGDFVDSHGFRAHGDLQSPENMAALRIAMARGGERRSLQTTRSREPADGILGCLDGLLRHTGKMHDGQRLSQLDALSDGEAQYLLGTIPPESRAQWPEPVGADNVDKLRTELAALLNGESLSFPDCAADGEPSSFPRWRLHELAADEPKKKAACMIAEIRCRKLSNPVVGRWCDLLQLVDETGVFSGRRPEFERRALHTAFPGAFDPPDRQDVDKPVGLGEVRQATARRLVDLVDAGGNADRLRRALRAFLGHDSLDGDARVDVLQRLSRVCADRLGDLDGARNALEHAWRCREQPQFLEQLVALDERADDFESALNHRRRHYQVLVHDRTANAESIARSGFHLAKCLERCGESREAIDHLRDLKDDFRETDVISDICLMLAELQIARGAHNDAAEVLESLMEIEPEHPKARRELVSLYHCRLDRPDRAFELQMDVVADNPSDEIEAERLVDVAAAADQLNDCVDSLADKARSSCDEQEAFEWLTTAARIADEELMEVRQASQLYRDALDHAESDAAHVESKKRRSALRSRGFCLARLSGEEQEALSTLRELLYEAPSETTTLRAMLELFERTREPDRQRLAKQGLAALGCSVDLDQVRSKLRPSRALDLETLDEHLLPEPLAGGVFEVLETTLPIVEGILEDEGLPSRSGLDVETHLPQADSPVDRAARAVETAVGAGALEVELADLPDSQTPAKVDPAAESVILDHQWSLDADRADLQFVLARLGTPLAAQLESLRQIGPERVVEVLEAIWRYQCDEPLRPRAEAPSKRLMSAVNSPLMAMTRRRAVSAIEPHRQALASAEPAEWLRAIDRFAGRLGLVLTGNLRVTVRNTLALGTDKGHTLEAVSRDEILRDVMAYAFDDGYRHARYALGLSGRPSQMSI